MHGMNVMNHPKYHLIPEPMPRPERMISIYLDIINEFLKSNHKSCSISIEDVSNNSFRTSLRNYIIKENITNVRVAVRKDKTFLYRTDMEDDKI
jgi:hypothetical protein